MVYIVTLIDVWCTAYDCPSGLLVVYVYDFDVSRAENSHGLLQLTGAVPPTDMTTVLKLSVF